MGAREILESTYYGVADIYHYPQTEVDGITTEGARALLYEGVRCALSKAGLNKAMESNGVNKVNYDALLFCAPELEIPAGCEIQVTQDGMSRLYRNTGEAFKYASHQELVLERMDHA